MIDVKFLRENPQAVRDGAAKKGITLDINKLLDVDKQYLELTTAVQQLREERNEFGKTIAGRPTDEQLQKGKALKEALDEKEQALTGIEQEREKMLLTIPALPKPDVKVGKDESENDVIKRWGDVPQFAFTPRDHVDVGKALDIIDMERAAKVSGARFAYLKNDGVLLELALAQFALDMLLKEGFTPVLPPVLIKRETMSKLGYMEHGGDEDMFAIEKDNLFLVGTAEQSLVPMHMDETLSVTDLPRRYVGYSSSFRREAGSYGKDTRGILRVHQFNKVEMISYVPEGQDDQEQEYLLSLEEKLFQTLNIPYQVIKMCTGDLGFPAARKYDVEAWMPGQGKYREVTSVSTVSDFQSRRLNIRYRDGDTTKFVNILNGTALAMSRTPIAIIENYQQEDGSIVVPEVLRKYMGKDIITPQK